MLRERVSVPHAACVLRDAPPDSNERGLRQRGKFRELEGYKSLGLTHVPKQQDISQKVDRKSFSEAKKFYIVDCHQTSQHHGLP